MKKINVHNVTESLSSKEMKAVTGGSSEGCVSTGCRAWCNQYDHENCTSVSDCSPDTVSAICGDLSNAKCGCTA